MHQNGVNAVVLLFPVANSKYCMCESKKLRPRLLGIQILKRRYINSLQICPLILPFKRNGVFSRPGWSLVFVSTLLQIAGYENLLFATGMHNLSHPLVRTRGHSFTDTPQGSIRCMWLSKGDVRARRILSRKTFSL